MTKKRTNVTLDPQVYQRAKSQGVNISQVTEKALQAYIDKLEGEGGSLEEIFGSSAREVPDQSVEEFLEDFRQSCRVDWNLAESTTNRRMSSAKKLVDFLDGHPLQADKAKLREFIQDFGTSHAIKSLRVIYGRYFDTDLADDFKVPTSSPTPKEVPDKSELKEIHDQLETPKLGAAFLLLASSGLRRGEVMELSRSQLKRKTRAIYPPKGNERGIKRQWVTYYNEEADRALEEIDIEEKSPREPIFADAFCPQTLTAKIGEASEQAGTLRVTPQTLRVWFADEMSRLGVSDRYIDAFCGRTPKSVLAKHYTDFSPRRLKEAYEEAGLEILGSGDT
ncbi:tyrosine-type recombinase/integrase [Candidatus Bipolaricaulota bacterium]|nr:tyrosine-type recombinase/integrase [Candidatus Bipolaricaulota bacterium]MBS3792403.1 tyrosine-type recombinase/integrase [Candidatus Bipolaricaulota bacterium]